MFYAEFDSKRGVLHYSNASIFCSPLLIRQDRSLEWLSEGSSLMLGLVEDKPFTEAQLTLEAGDYLLLYGQSLIRALSPVGAALELEGPRLRAILQRSAGATPAEVIAAIFDGVQAFRDRALLGSLETLRGLVETMRDPCPLGTVEPFQAEAHKLRDPGIRREDLALIVMSQPSM